jgi:polar amino acid transport system substrate-binding protein
MCPRHLPLVAILSCGAPFAWGCGAASAAQDPPLRAGVAAGSPPFVIQPERGPLTGFTIELFRALAGHMKREIRFTAAPSDELAGDLEARKFDLLPGPIDATPEAATHLLFTEGYTVSEYEFGSRASQPIRGFADLHGRRLAVVAGSAYAGWAERNAARYGFTVQLHATIADVLGALTANTADATLTSSPVIDSAAAHDPALSAGLSLTETRTQGAAAFRKRDAELRDEVEEALRCLKEDGTVARLANVWLGTNPGDEDIEKLAMPGYGVPGLSGFDPKTQKAHC